MSILAFFTGPNSALSGTPSQPMGTTSSSYKAADAQEAVGYHKSLDIARNTFDFPSVGDFWMSFSMHVRQSSAWTTGFEIVYVEDVFRIYGTTAEDYDFQYWNGSSWTNSGFLANPNVTIRVDIEFVRHATTGALRIYLDNSLAYEITGDTTGMAASSDSIRFGNPSNSASYPTYISSFMLADEDTRGITMVQHTITGNGTYHTDGGGGYTGIDHFGAFDDTAPVLLAATNDQQTYTKSAIPGAYSSYDVVAVGVCGRSLVPVGSAINNMEMIIADGTNTATFGDNAVGEAYAPIMDFITTAADGTALTVAHVDAEEIGWKAKA